jgi:hypothetical protein
MGYSRHDPIAKVRDDGVKGLCMFWGVLREGTANIARTKVRDDAS